MAEKKFRTAMNGYNKEDVHHYIEELAVEAEQKLLQKEEYIKKMEHELARVRNENTKYKSETEQTRRQYLMEIDGLKEELEKLRLENNRLEQAAAAMPEEVPQPARQEEQATEKSRLLEAENQRLNARVQVLEEERDKIPTALIVAQQQADQIVQSSRDKMEQYEEEMRVKVESQYQAGKERLEQLKERIEGSYSVLGDMENQVRLATSKFVQSIEQSKRETAELAKVFQIAPESHQENEEDEQKQQGQ